MGGFVRSLGRSVGGQTSGIPFYRWRRAEEDSILSSVASQRGAPRRRPRHSDDGNGPQSDMRGLVGIGGQRTVMASSIYVHHTSIPVHFSGDLFMYLCRKVHTPGNMVANEVVVVVLVVVGELSGNNKREN